jgi:hypothetical protein
MFFMELVRHRKGKPFFDPKRARAIGARRLAQAARAFCRAHRWKRRGDEIRTRRGTVLGERTFEELGASLLRAGALVKTRDGYRDKYTGQVYGTARRAA